MVCAKAPGLRLLPHVHEIKLMQSAISAVVEVDSLNQFITAQALRGDLVVANRRATAPMK